MVGFLQAEEEEHGSLSGKGRPALKRSHKKQPKRFCKKRVTSAAALNPVGGDKGIAGDDQGIAGDSKGISGDDKGTAEETAAASKRSSALANKLASTTGDCSRHLPTPRTSQAT